MTDFQESPPDSADTLDRYARNWLQIRADNGLHRTVRSVGRIDGRTVRIDGAVVLNFGSNDYLGLALNPLVADAARAALRADGAGATGSRLTSGTTGLHIALEQEIAAWKGTAAALLFSSGYAAAVGTVPALVGEGDLILSDSLNHASLIDGCRLSRSTVHIFRHSDTSHLARLLEQRSSYGNCLVVTEGVFSMDGDLAPLTKMARLCDESGAWLMVDDAHGGGVLGPGGAGTAAHCGLEGQISIQMGTLGKALGAEGGFIAGSQALIDLLTNRARTFIFGTALGPATVGAARQALAVAAAADDRRERLYINGALLRDGLQAAGYEIPTGITPIVPVIVGEAERASALSQRLLARGIWAPAIRPPTVPEGQARLRVSLTSEHGVSDIQLLIEALARELPWSN